MSDDLAFQRATQDLLRRTGQSEVKEAPLYATGAFTPTIVGLTVAGTFTYDATETFCNWTRIGNRVLFNGRARITVITVAPTGALTIAGFPYPAATLPTGSSPAGCANFSLWYLTVPAGFTQVGALFLEGESFVRLIRNGSGVAASGVLGGELALVGGVADFRFEGQYQV